jgi:predicted enzyme related to lactoylglutathione lyase
MADAATTLEVRPSFVKLTVPDAEKAEKFYCEVFGFVRELYNRMPGFLELVLKSPENGLDLVLMCYDDQSALELGNGWGPLGFDTNDLDGLTDRAVAAGATVTMGPGEFEGTRYVFLKSPDGHQIEFIQHGE